MIEPRHCLKKNFKKGYQKIKNLSTPTKGKTEKRPRGSIVISRRKVCLFRKKDKKLSTAINPDMGLKLSLASIIPPFYGHGFLSFLR